MTKVAREESSTRTPGMSGKTPEAEKGKLTKGKYSAKGLGPRWPGMAKNGSLPCNGKGNLLQ